LSAGVAGAIFANQLWLVYTAPGGQLLCQPAILNGSTPAWNAPHPIALFQAFGQPTLAAFKEPLHYAYRSPVHGTPRLISNASAPDGSRAWSAAESVLSPAVTDASPTLCVDASGVSPSICPWKQGGVTGMQSLYSEDGTNWTGPYRVQNNLTSGAPVAISAGMGATYLWIGGRARTAWTCARQPEYAPS
jgi:hypothetical protein